VSNMLKGTGVPVTDYHLDTVEEEGNLKTYVSSKNTRVLDP